MSELKPMYTFFESGFSAAEMKDVLVEKLLTDKALLYEVMIDLETEPYPVPWRAAWILDAYFAKDPGQIETHLPWMKRMYISHQSEGVLRILGKIISGTRITKDDGPVVEKAFDLMEDRRMAVAVRVHAMQIIFEAGRLFPELHGELLRTFDLFELEEPRPALKVRMRDIRNAVASLQLG